MLFNSTLYGLFLVITYIGFWLLRENRAYRTVFLVASSYAFYILGTFESARETASTTPVPLGPFGWTALCVLIIFAGSSLDFNIGLWLAKTEDPKKRKQLLLLSVFYYLGVLAIFKYYDFAVDSVTTMLSWMSIKASPAKLHLVLPFGISFFTFETMSYTIDVYRKEIEPCRRYWDYLLFVCFFPHLVAGPIVRPQQMLPQFAEGYVDPVDANTRNAEGFFLIARGLAKKLILGDTLALGMVGRVFDNPERYSSIEIVLGVYAYAIQIYADFSGYTDVALGSARLFGFNLPENFKAPYLSLNLQDFWRRWHISLSSWLRDYLYVPLGGSRGSADKTYRNLMITMLLGGLWHGASWNFVIWGFLHGLALGVTRAWQRSRSASAAPSSTANLGAMFLTFNYVCFAWIFFRAPTFSSAVEVLRGIATGGFGTRNLSTSGLLTLALGFAAHAAPEAWTTLAKRRFADAPALMQGLLLASAAYLLHFLGTAKSQPFVYGQF
jgi:alginate O-acetyltransferase complex protein AlgI